MKILISTGIYPPDIGGPATYIPRLAKFISCAGDNSTVISLSNDIESHKEAIILNEGLKND
jgi:hypothetical protein